MPDCGNLDMNGGLLECFCCHTHLDQLTFELLMHLLPMNNIGIGEIGVICLHTSIIIVELQLVFICLHTSIIIVELQLVLICLHTSILYCETTARS